MIDAEPLKQWFLKNRRDLPWRKEKTPYRVLVSEMMLQQTRASAVIGHFERWIDRFPNIFALAKAKEGEVMKLWEGLGYYSRARNLWKMAQTIVHAYGGNIPSSLEELLQLKGIGPYTAAAVLSFGFGKKAAALDGNVSRVLSRYLLFKKEVVRHRKELRNLLDQMLPEVDAPIVMEAFIELGARLCVKKPLCELCPLQKRCKAYRKGVVDQLPLTSVKPKITTLFRFVACIHVQNFYLLRKGEKGFVMAGLFEFPSIACEIEPHFPSYQKKLEESYGLSLQFVRSFPQRKQHFTRFRVYLFPSLFEALARKPVTKYVWVEEKTLKELPFSSGHKDILKNFIQ